MKDKWVGQTRDSRVGNPSEGTGDTSVTGKGYTSFSTRKEAG